MSTMDQTDYDARAERAAALKARKDFRHSAIGAKAAALWGAMTEYFKFRAEGVSREDAAAGLVGYLRDLFRLSKFPAGCDACDNTGWRTTVCEPGMRCERRLCRSAGPELRHTYAVPCECPQGDRHRKRIAAIDDELVAVGRRSKAKRSFTRMGV